MVAVRENGFDTSSIGESVRATYYLSTEPISRRFLVSGNDDIVSLANSDGKSGCVERFDRNEISGDDLEVMTVKGDLEHVVQRDVD